ncbi:hypothetical protein NQ318_007849 [Aromia moschata]|uniref:Amine oxidase domain-containing protein n=1 Tax=Aromia moschata TaxID=1265417 RepID=A0AAV8Z2K1_9CUCU|nr:hypothetical protein NQ318_007849 [Aromia moschata]
MKKSRRVGIIVTGVLPFVPETFLLWPGTRWFSNPWIKGSYCHITPECDHSGSVMDKLAQPVFVENVPRIILAGEAVHPSHYSTTHGAYESGLQQAALLYEYIMEQENNFFNK